MKILSESELNKLKAIELNMLTDIDKLCRDHEIKYSLAAGTLLGAIRHKGFIPWDDDIDIMLRREEYDKLRDCVKLYGKELYWVDYYTYEGYPYPFSKIMMKNTILIEESNKYATAPDGVFIDVFPIDNTTQDYKKRKAQYKKVTKWKQRLVTRENYYFGQTGVKEWYRLIRRNLFNCFPKKLFIDIIERECRKYAKTDTLISLTGTVGTEKATYPKEWFDNYIELEFAGKNFMAIRKCKELLEQQYGNYMELPPKKEQVPHHFVCDFKI